MLGFSPGALVLSLSGLCENRDAAAQEGHPIPSLARRRGGLGVGRAEALAGGSSV